MNKKGCVTQKTKHKKSIWERGGKNSIRREANHFFTQPVKHRKKDIEKEEVPEELHGPKKKGNTRRKGRKSQGWAGDNLLMGEARRGILREGGGGSEKKY